MKPARHRGRGDQLAHNTLVTNSRRRVARVAFVEFLEPPDRANELATDRPRLQLEFASPLSMGFNLFPYPGWTARASARIAPHDRFDRRPALHRTSALATTGRLDSLSFSARLETSGSEPQLREHTGLSGSRDEDKARVASELTVVGR
jgi:hypothetical protein